MAILSKRIMTDVSRIFHAKHGLRPYFMNLSGRVTNAEDRLSVLSNTRRRRDYALQTSINQGEPYTYQAVPGVATFVIGLEHRRMVHGALIGAEVLIQGGFIRKEALTYLVAQGMAESEARKFLQRLVPWSEGQLSVAARDLQELFYQVSGWDAELMKENRLKALQFQQINQAIEDQKRSGKEALYAFEKERALLANIRAGDKNGARRILNEMLATIYMSSPRLGVLRARAVELMSCLTRAAIEDNPLMEPLIERNHAWTERLITAQSFEELSQVLMDALDNFIEGIYLHGMNRSNTNVRKALDVIGEQYMKKISLCDVAAAVALTPSRLAHIIKEFTGRTFLQILHEVRVRHAQHLLEHTTKSCAEIAYDVGFGDQSYFIKHFRRVTSTTPARYRRLRAG